MCTAQRNGTPPKIVARFHSLDGLTEAIKARLGIHTGTQALAGMGAPHLIWRPLPELDPLTHSIAWRTGDTRTVVADFVRAATDVFSAMPG
jgi:hypothetical protein